MTRMKDIKLKNFPDTLKEKGRIWEVTLSAIDKCKTLEEGFKHFIILSYAIQPDNNNNDRVVFAIWQTKTQIIICFQELYQEKRNNVT